MKGLTTMDKRLDDARSDATATLAALGVLAAMVSHAEAAVRDGVKLAGEGGAKSSDFGSRLAEDAAGALKSAREGIAKVLQHLGDFFNESNGCSATVEAPSEPVFDAPHKRAGGVSLED